MPVPVKPMPDYIFVRQNKAPKKTASGILLPESQREKPKTAEVLAVGENVTTIKVGENVIYSDDYQAGNVNFPIDNEECIIVHQKNIVATVK